MGGLSRRRWRLDSKCRMASLGEPRWWLQWRRHQLLKVKMKLKQKKVKMKLVPTTEKKKRKKKKKKMTARQTRWRSEKRLNFVLSQIEEKGKTEHSGLLLL